MIEKQKNIRLEIVYFIYWLVLVAWQNISGVASRTTIDLVIKAGLLVFFVGYHFINTKNINLVNSLPVFLTFLR